MRRKLLAIATACCLAAATMIPVWAADSGSVKKIKNEEELAAAIAAQKDGETWELEAGTYELTQAHLDVYKDIKPADSNQGNWYFPITSKIKIVGTGDVVLTSNVETENGTWATQDFISVWADGVTIENIDIKSKKSVNKAIEIMAKDFTLKDVTILPQEAEDKTVNSGSIYFSVEDAGKSMLQNVTVSSWITARGVTAGSIELKDTVIDFSNNTKASKSDVYTAISGSKFVNNGLTVKVDNNIVDLNKQVLANIPGKTIVELTEDMTIDEELYVKTNDFTLKGNGHKITASDDFKMNIEGQINLVKVEADNVTLEDISLIATEKNKHTLDTYGANNLVLKNVVLDHEKASSGAPLIINGSVVKVEGNLTLKTGEKSWYGINLDNKGDIDITAEIIFTEGAALKQEGAEKPLIFSEKPEEVKVTNPENVGIVKGENGTYREEIKATAIKLDADKKELKAGESFTLKATVAPENADNKTVVWSSSDEKVATVDEAGKVTAVGAGTATITAKVGEATASCTVTVTKAAVEEEKPDQTPETGINSYVLLFVLLAFVSVAVVFVSKKEENR